MPTGYNYKENQKGAGVSKPMPGPDNSIKQWALTSQQL